MIDKDLAKFVAIANDHYWGSLERERDIILWHINAIVMTIIKNNYEERNNSLNSTSEISAS